MIEPRINHVGEKYGKLEVIEPTDMRKKGNIVWKAKCLNCGAESFRTISRIKVGTCNRCKFNNIQEMVGKEFGALTVLEIVLIKNRTAFRCKCVCGKEKFVQLNSLFSGSVKSCGCLRRTSAVKHGVHAQNRDNLVGRSPREKDIVKLYKKGMSYAEIAKQLNISGTRIGQIIKRVATRRESAKVSKRTE